MASFEETALVLQEVAQIFSQDDDAQAIREIFALQREIAALKDEQQQRLKQTLGGIASDVKRAKIYTARSTCNRRFTLCLNGIFH